MLMRVTRYRILSNSFKPRVGDNKYIAGMPCMDQLFNARYGVGQTPFNENIEYEGVTCYMKPKEFLFLAKVRTEYPNSNFMKRCIEEGTPMGNPFLTLHWVIADKFWQTGGHEGRTRCKAIQDVFGDNVLIPVHLLLRPSKNSRTTDEMLFSKIECEDISDIFKTFPKERYDRDSKGLNVSRPEGMARRT
jgi:hypothetical protein